jgi:hypothetical protein
MRSSKLMFASALAALAVACGPAPEEGMGDETQAPVVTDSQQDTSAPEESKDEGRQVNAMAYCSGWNNNYCLTTCAGDASNTLHVVGYHSAIGGYGRCIEAADNFCLWYFGTVRRSACWGWP